jgi:hypothetical protein
MKRRPFKPIAGERIVNGYVSYAAPARCMNCGRPGAHFLPPSLGEPGFFICEDGS